VLFRAATHVNHIDYSLRFPNASNFPEQHAEIFFVAVDKALSLLGPNIELLTEILMECSFFKI
jgi:hypothetical protein